MSEAPRLTARQRAQYDLARRAYAAMQAHDASQVEVRTFERDRRAMPGVIVHEVVRAHVRKAPQAHQPWPTLPPFTPQPRGVLENRAPRHGDPMLPAHAAEAPLASVVQAVRLGEYKDAAIGTAEVAAVMAIPAARGARTKVRPTAAPKKDFKTLEQYVEELQAARNGRPALFNYETYLSDPLRTINGRVRGFESQEPDWAKGKDPKIPQRAKNLDHWQVVDSLRRKRDEAMLLGPQGHLVNPWYWPAPMYHAWKSELGPELAHRELSRFFEYTGATSMMTNVNRNVVEAWTLMHFDRNGIPINEHTLNGSDLTGFAHKNKVLIAGQVARGEGLVGEFQHKIRNYGSLNLHGVGVAQPEYIYTAKGPMRVLDPVTLDGVMSEAMRLRDEKGEPAKVFRGPIYRHGMKTINRLADEVGAAAGDTQPPIWQVHQFRKHKDPAYFDTFARAVDDVVGRVSRQKGEDPQKTLSDMIHSRERPPNFFNVPSILIAAPIAGLVLQQMREQE